ncbi:MAG: hypothetical protein LQ349_000479 [Xanthoria aureola]|nr:MAG: hypothetical protein LQ349_000479 [Xanthoria aureola]
MWTLAMSLSTQFENMREKMYAETRQMLEARDLGENDMVQVRIEQAQAWIMVTFYEFLRTDYRRGYMSAGRVFRLVQLLRLHEVDSPTANAGNLSAASFGESNASEERRRVFWVAYCLDRFICVGEKGLLTLNEDVVRATSLERRKIVGGRRTMTDADRFQICTCLPSLEIDHQDSHVAPMWFLSEAVTSSLSFSPLAECAITATLCGRVLAHDQVSAVEKMYGNAARDFWVRHEWLQGILKKRRDSLYVNHPRCSAFADPMLIFTSMTLHATTIYLCEIAETSNDVERHTETVIEYQNQALMAAREIARLSKEQDQAHVFMPFAVFLSARRLITHRRLNPLKGDRLETESLEGELQECMEALDKMQKMNNLAKYYLQVLKSEDFLASPRFAVGRQSCTIEIGHEL